MKTGTTIVAALSLFGLIGSGCGRGPHPEIPPPHGEPGSKLNQSRDIIANSFFGGVNVTAISLWENKNDADSYNTNTYPQVLKTLARFIEGTPQVNTFDVVTSTFQKHDVLATA